MENSASQKLDNGRDPSGINLAELNVQAVREGFESGRFTAESLAFRSAG
jgi:hypothetical protein